MKAYGSCRICGNRFAIPAAPWKTLRVSHSSHRLDDDERIHTLNRPPIRVNSSAGLTLTLGNSPVADGFDPYWASMDDLAAGPYFDRERVEIEQANPTSMSIPMDLDQDGDADLIAISMIPPEELTPLPPFYDEENPPNPWRVYRNLGDGTFDLATDEILPNPPQSVHPRHYVIADFDMNGLLDLFVADHGPDPHPNPGPGVGIFPGALDQLVMQYPGGHLVDESAARLPAAYGFTHNACAADIDGDEDVDIFLANLGTICLEGDPTCTAGECGDVCPRFLLNDGDGGFVADGTLIPTELLENDAPSSVCELFDADGDSDPDLFLDTDKNVNPSAGYLLVNTGGTFVQSASPMPARQPGVGSWEACAGDFDLDGFLDFFNFEAGNTGDNTWVGIQLLLNNGDGSFRDETARVQFQPSEDAPGNRWTNLCIVEDLNLDGWPDVVLTGIGEHSRILINKGDATFETATPQLADLVTNFSAGYIPAPLNDDEWIDLVAIYTGGAGLLEQFFQVAPYPATPIFADGFESGDTSLW